MSANASRVTWYRLAWSHGQRVGAVTLVCQGNVANSEHHLTGLTSQELHALADLLRNERPVFYDPHQQLLYTGNEMVGEEEVD